MPENCKAPCSYTPSWMFELKHSKSDQACTGEGCWETWSSTGMPKNDVFRGRDSWPGHTQDLSVAY